MNLIKIVFSLHYHNIFRRLAFFHVPFNHWVVFEFGVTILQIELNVLESCFHSCLEHYICRNVEYIVRLFRSCFDNKFELFKVFWLFIIWLSVKSSPKIVFWCFYPRKISDNYITILFYVFFALKNQFF